MIQNPFVAGFAAAGIFLSWMGLVILLKSKLRFPGSLSRKIIHIGTGPIYLLSWNLFPKLPISKYVAAIIPFFVVIILLLTASRVIRNPLLIKLMSRHGNEKELINGPMFYGIIFVVFTILFWKTVYAIIPLTILCVGDGFAEVIGSSIRSAEIPWARAKTLLGSLSMFIFGTIGSLLMLLISDPSGTFPKSLIITLAPLAVINLISVFIESVSPSNYDNLTVPTAALISSLLIFPKG